MGLTLIINDGWILITAMAIIYVITIISKLNDAITTTILITIKQHEYEYGYGSRRKCRRE